MLRTIKFNTSEILLPVVDMLASTFTFLQNATRFQQENNKTILYSFYNIMNTRFRLTM